MTDDTAGVSSRDEVERLLARMGDVEPLVNAVCTLDPDALAQADALDREAADGRRRGPLHGRAVLVKDNIDTHDLPTTAGSLALADVPPPGGTRRSSPACARQGWSSWARRTCRSGPTSATRARPRGGARTAA